MNHFLDTVLPTQGRYCVAEFYGKNKDHHFSDTTIEAETTLSTTAPTSDVYIALASFSEDRRLAANAHLMRSVFVDLDCGPGKPYADHPAAAVALRAFIQAQQLPNPTFIVNSGGGLHVYWSFEEDLDIPTWGPIARGFKTLCLDNGLQIDPSVTADAARIMRMPGTMNNKQAGNPRPVQILHQGSVVSLAAFQAHLPPPSIDLSAASVYGMDATTEALSKSDLDPCSFQRIARKSLTGASGCAQIRVALEEAAVLEEPLWRAALSIAWNCEDGPTAIHKLSRNHPGYNSANTTAKAQALTGKPYTCDWYRNNYPATCQGCTHKVGSPIVLGRVIKEAPANPDGTYTIEAPKTQKQKPMVLQMPPLPQGYFRGTNGGVFTRAKSDATGEWEEEEVYAHDLYVMERFYDTDEGGDGEGEQVTLCVNLPQDGLRQFVTPLANLLATDSLRNALSKHGVISYGRQTGKIMNYLAKSISQLQRSSGSHQTRSQMGWTPERHFVVGNIEYTPDGPKLAPPASSIRNIAPLFHPKGDVATWKEIIETYNTPGFELLAFAFLVGAGSPFLQMMDNSQVRGGVVHLVSNQSGSGKTSAQMAINSIFGHPLRMMQAESDTFNAKLHCLGMHNSVCVTIDEITNMPAHEVSELVYAATTGRAKHRMEAQSNKLRANHSSWCLFTVTSGNAVLSDQLLAHKVAAEGELKRLVELRIPKEMDHVSRETIAKFQKLSDNYGVAGPLLTQYIVSNYELVRIELMSMHERLVTQQGFDRTDRFYTHIMTCASMAGKVLKRLELADLDLHRILSKAMAAIRGSKQTAEISTGVPATMALETLSGFINENMNNMLVIKSESKNEAAIVQPKGSLKIRYEPDTQDLIIIASELRNFFTARRVDFRSSLQEFINMGALKRTPDGANTMSKRPAAGAQNSSLKGAPVRCYVFNSTLLGLQDLPSDRQPKPRD